MPDWIKNIDPASVEAIATAVASIVVAVGAAIGRVRRAIGKAIRKARGRAGPPAAVLLLAVGLSGCGAVGIAGGVIATGVSAYCAGVSDAGKDIVRDTVTAGQKILACEDGDAAAE